MRDGRLLSAALAAPFDEGIPSLASRSAGLGVSAGFQKVFIEDGEAIIGLAVTFGRPSR